MSKVTFVIAAAPPLRSIVVLLFTLAAEALNSAVSAEPGLGPAFQLLPNPVLNQVASLAPVQV